MEMAEALFDESAWKEVLRKLCAAFDCYSAQIVQHTTDFEDGYYADFVFWGDAPTEAADEFARQCGRHDPVSEKVLETGLLGKRLTLASHDICSDRHWQSSPWSEFRSAHGKEHLLFSCMKERPGFNPCVLTLFKRDSAGEFGARDAAILDELTHDLDRSFMPLLQHRKLISRINNLENLLSSSTVPMWLIDRRRRVLAQNRAGEEVTRHSAILRNDFNKLSISGSCDQSLELALIACSRGRTADLVVRDRTREPWLVRLSPAPSADTTRFIVSAWNNNPPTDYPARDTIKQFFDLTRAECEVAGLLAQDIEPRHIAEIRGTTMTTLRT